jgi:hypothetical protein
MESRLNYSGFVVAGLAFFLTRFTVTLALEDTVQFYLAGVVPLGPRLESRRLGRRCRFRLPGLAPAGWHSGPGA